MLRAHAREIERAERRGRSRAKQLSAGAALALGAGVMFAPSAEAATFTVNSNADAAATPCDATCTLRDAIEAADADAAADTITFAANVTGQIEIAASDTPFEIDSAMTIAGPGAATLAIDGDASSQLFYIEPANVGSEDDPVTITGLTLRDGALSGSGGAIYSSFANLTLANDVFARNTSEDDEGGALYADDGKLTITSTTFSGNTAGSGGALYTDNDNATGTGAMTVDIRDTTFRGNSAFDYAGGAAYFDDETDGILIAGSTFVGNSAKDGGGAIKFYGPETGEATIQDSTITGNTAGRIGGAISAYSSYDRPVNVLNSTLSGNYAGDAGGGIYEYGYDDTGVDSPGVDVVNVSSTILNNESPTGPDLFLRTDSGSSPVVGSFTVGFSLIGNPAGGAAIANTGPNLTGVDPKLGALAGNGGPTQTQLPAADSPVLDAGIANGLGADQRGLARTVKTSFTPASDGTDIGAVELQDGGLTGATITAKKKQAQKGKKIVVKVTVGADEDVNADASGTVKAGKTKAKLKKVSKTVQGGQTTTLKLSPKGKKSSKAIAKVLASGKKAKASLTVKLTDPAGNSTTKRPKVTLK